MCDSTLDTRMHLAEVEHLKRVSAGGVVTSDDLTAGFMFDGRRVSLINPQHRIFKPASMRYPA